MNKLRGILSLFIIFLILLFGFQFSKRFFIRGSREVVIKSWEGYKKFFVNWEGRVIRKKDNDSVAEGQALALLRAVWMNDQETFARIYDWTERNLSRSGLHSGGKKDHLLAWKWQDNRITDFSSTTGANIDYALALILADRRWPNLKPPIGLFGPEEKVKHLLDDILEKMTYRVLTGRLYLAPGEIDKSKKLEKYPLNPSNYSPAHFKIFYEFTGDDRWLELADTAYRLLMQLADGTKNVGSVGLFPDFCSVNNNDEIEISENLSFDFGWEAVQIPYRLALDYYWYDSAEVIGILKGFAQFFREQWNENDGTVYCEYSHDGQAQAKYEDALFYGSYYLAFKILGFPETDAVFDKLRSIMKRFDDRLIIWEDEYAYLTNGYVYIVEGYNARIIRKDF